MEQGEIISARTGNESRFLARVRDTERSSQDARAVLGTFAEPNRNRRVSSSLSPIFYLFLAPSGILYLKVQQLLASDESHGASPPPMVSKRRPGPKQPNYGIPTEDWPTIVHRVVEQKEPLSTVAVAYGVSHETIRRLMLHVHQQRGKQET
jgi:hypothetical protein